MSDCLSCAPGFYLPANAIACRDCSTPSNVTVLAGSRAYSGSTIQSGNFGSGNYANNEDRVWILSSGGQGNVVLTFTAFSTLLADWVIVYSCTDSECMIDGTRFSGSSVPPPQKSTSGLMKVVWHSDGSSTSSGWSATFGDYRPSSCRRGSLSTAPTLWPVGLTRVAVAGLVSAGLTMAFSIPAGL
jgi:hypothetical protein